MADSMPLGLSVGGDPRGIDSGPWWAGCCAGCFDGLFRVWSPGEWLSRSCVAEKKATPMPVSGAGLKKARRRWAFFARAKVAFPAMRRSLQGDGRVTVAGIGDETFRYARSLDWLRTTDAYESISCGGANGFGFLAYLSGWGIDAHRKGTAAAATGRCPQCMAFGEDASFGRGLDGAHPYSNLPVGGTMRA